MAKQYIINPKGTASWLIDNTSLTFDQIAEFCGIHYMEVEAIADGEVIIAESNPLENFQLTPEEIARCEENEEFSLNISPDTLTVINTKTKGRKYVGMAKRTDVLCGALYLLIKYNHLSDKEISSLCGATANAVGKIRDGSHAAIKGLSAKNPVIMGLCTQKELDEKTIVSRPAGKPAAPTAVDNFIFAHDKK